MEKFREAADELAMTWDQYQSALIKAEKQRVEKDGFSWSEDGYAALEKALSGKELDIKTTLEDWQHLKETNLCDSMGFTRIAKRLADQFDAYKYLLEKSKTTFSFTNRTFLTKGLEAVCAEVGIQGKSLLEPVKVVTTALDKFAKEELSPKDRQKLEAALKIESPDKFWSETKKKFTKLITDKAVSNKVDAVFSGYLGKTLSTWSSITNSPNLDKAQLVAVSRTLTDILTLYDSKLARIDMTSASADSNGGVTGLRECLRVIAERVSHDTGWVGRYD